MDAPVILSRRELLQLGMTATGLVLGVAIDTEAQKAPSRAQLSPRLHQLNTFVHVATDGTITLYIPRAEVGQSAHSTLAMLIAEEMEADWNMVRVRQAPLRPEAGDQRTHGMSVSVLWEPLRSVGATARELLVREAAQRWNVTPDTCRARNGTVTHVSTGRTLSFGALAEGAAKQVLQEPASLKPDTQFTLIGRSVRRRDTLSKIDGTAVYGIDFRLPGMVFAVMARPPVAGSAPNRVDDRDAKKVRGVRQILHLGERGVAVVADTTWTAIQGRNALKVEWGESEAAQESSDALRTTLSEAVSQPGKVVYRQGTPPEDADLKSVEALYELPFQAHAPMEPPNCTARVQGGRCELWLATQNPERVRRAVAEALQLPVERVVLNPLMGGGSFGQDRSGVACEAALVAQKAGRPVKLLYTREDDLQHDDYRPASAHRLTALLSAEGLPVSLTHAIASTPPTAGDAPEETELWGAAASLYAIPHVQVEYTPVPASLRRGEWRSGSHSNNAFAIESFLDELAVAAGKDPIAFRLALIGPPREVASPDGAPIDTGRMRRVLEVLADRGGYARPFGGVQARRGRGMACHIATGSYCAQSVELEVDADGRVKVTRVVCVVDCGRNVHPDTVVAQVEGSIAYALTAALKASITVENGQVMQANFHNYPVLHIGEMPKVEVFSVASTAHPGGVGVVAVPPLAPALCNAIHAATGKRVRRLPVRTRELRQR
ncbi:MAG: molybdopterin cofactor-binding domain-containing protein [Chloroherpetonaceae bacterium]|nr:molybdopterin-dependent oxidoreductase [Chthonomonadaceae bacterium]MDW8208022.1 molybdopterin cofactor-binding domain-containing protein [Chloroherpetonaceae bacterium]